MPSLNTAYALKNSPSSSTRCDCAYSPATLFLLIHLLTPPRLSALWGQALSVFIAEPPELTSGSDTHWVLNKYPLNERPHPHMRTRLHRCAHADRQTDRRHTHTLTHSHQRSLQFSAPQSLQIVETRACSTAGGLDLLNPLPMI